MKRSRRIHLVLLGISVGTMAGCQPDKPPITPEAVYVNDDYLPGVGYYHAPFRGWYAFPYNYFDSNRKEYFYGGNWSPIPWVSITNVSSPTTQAAASAESRRTDIVIGGFGSTGGTHYYTGS